LQGTLKSKLFMGQDTRPPASIPKTTDSVPIRQRVFITLALVALVGVSWSGVLERNADQRLTATLQRALITAAIARGLNGVISVAQGTEIAIQPVGVGVTISAGEILDPLNDLVERFSWLALVASASLGTQLLLTEVSSEPVISAVLTGVAAIYLLVLWLPTRSQQTSLALRVLALALLARFLFTIVALTVGWVDAWVLETRQQTAMVGLTSASDEIKALRTEPLPEFPTESSIRQRFEALIDESRELLDLESRLEALQNRAEAAIEDLLSLIVLFVVQTLLVPIGAFWLSLGAFRWFWSWARQVH